MGDYFPNLSGINWSKEFWSDASYDGEFADPVIRNVFLRNIWLLHTVHFGSVLFMTSFGGHVEPIHHISEILSWVWFCPLLVFMALCLMLYTIPRSIQTTPRACILLYGAETVTLASAFGLMSHHANSMIWQIVAAHLAGNAFLNFLWTFQYRIFLQWGLFWSSAINAIVCVMVYVIGSAIDHQHQHHRTNIPLGLALGGAIITYFVWDTEGSMRGWMADRYELYWHVDWAFVAMSTWPNLIAWVNGYAHRYAGDQLTAGEDLENQKLLRDHDQLNLADLAEYLAQTRTVLLDKRQQVNERLDPTTVY